jgi:hypothetical protein
MKATFKEISGSIVAPRGFLAAGVFCDIKRLGTGKGSQKGKKRDLALIVSEVPATVAGMFTTNQVCAAPVKVCIERVKDGVAQAIVVNSGNANACTGKRGMKDAYEMAAITARAVAAVYDRRGSLAHPALAERRYKVRPEHVLVASTGRIGVTLPMKNVKTGILDAVTRLDEAQFTPGNPLFRSRLYLFCCIPWGHSNLTLLQWNEGTGFVEQSPMTGMKLWRHERWIESSHSGCVLRDRLTFEPRFAGPLVAWFVRKMFTHRHAVLQKRLGH